MFVCVFVCLSRSDVRPIFSPPSWCHISNLSMYLESLDHCGLNKIVCKQIKEEIKIILAGKKNFQVLLRVSFRHHVIPTPCHSDTMSFRHFLAEFLEQIYFCILQPRRASKGPPKAAYLRVRKKRPKQKKSYKIFKKRGLTAKLHN